ncbi:hypothetical protein J6TS1_28510 [Siminovitchia terrae]|uniref:Transposase n=1 Tax=Siminovitchia terrae TaxID=1914933 RepID=A0ABQ4KYF0_SIMTE|nr:hypothetical protein J6TS1_28510 [Siminovitchia terrae]
MSRYDKALKEEAVILSDEIGPKKAAAQLGVSCRIGENREPCTATERISGADVTSGHAGGRRKLFAEPCDVVLL